MPYVSDNKRFVPMYTFAMVFARFSLSSLWKTWPVVQGPFSPRGSDSSHRDVSASARTFPGATSQARVRFRRIGRARLGGARHLGAGAHPAHHGHRSKPGVPEKSGTLTHRDGNRAANGSRDAVRLNGWCAGRRSFSSIVRRFAGKDRGADRWPWQCRGPSACFRVWADAFG